MIRGLRRTTVLVAAAVCPAFAQDGSPGGRPGASMVYDAARKHTVLFGGLTTDASGGRAFARDLWAWNGQAWRKLQPADGVEPPGRMLPNLAYDAARQRVLMFGGRRQGNGGVQLPTDIWEWDGTRWHKAADSLALLHATTAYDPVRHRIEMFGGLNQSGLSKKLMEWNGSAWVARDTVGPPTGENPALAASSAVTPTGNLILVTEQSGNSRDSVAMLTWTLSGKQWIRGELGPAMTNLQPTASAPDGTIFIYQLYGEWLTTPLLHVRTPDGKWTSRALPNQPTGRDNPAAVYDADRQRFILHGEFGRPGASETWEFDGKAWTLRTNSPGGSPK